MKKLLALLLLFWIVGCEQEPTQLEKCVAANVENRGEFDLLNKWIPYYKELTRIDNEVRALVESGELILDEYNKNPDKYHDYTSIDGFLDSLTKDERKAYFDISYAFNNKETGEWTAYTYEQLLEQIKTAQANFIKSFTDRAKNICNMQGIY